MKSSAWNKCCLWIVLGLQIKARHVMGRGILLWMLGIPIPIIIILALIWH